MPAARIVTGASGHGALDIRGAVLIDPAEEKPKPSGLVEVVRSVSFKLNLGNYQSMDFFCSQKAQCAAEDVDSYSADLYEWCFDQVMESVRDVQAKQAKKEASKANRSAA